MSRFEERIMELIQQLREEIRMNDQRIKQLSSGSGGGVDLTALMLKAIYDQDEDGVVDNSKRLDGYTLEEILSQSGGGSGDMTKAVYDIDDDGVVDNAEKLDGHPASDFALTSHTHENMGDMLKAVYDTDGDGVVDNSTKVDGRKIYVENRPPEPGEGNDGDIWIEYQE